MDMNCVWVKRARSWSLSATSELHQHGGCAQVIESINTEYGEGAPRGSGPSQGRLQKEGNAYLIESYPRLSYVKSIKRR